MPRTSKLACMLFGAVVAFAIGTSLVFAQEYDIYPDVRDNGGFSPWGGENCVLIRYYDHTKGSGENEIICEVRHYICYQGSTPWFPYFKKDEVCGRY